MRNFRWIAMTAMLAIALGACGAPRGNSPTAKKDQPTPAPAVKPPKPEAAVKPVASPAPTTTKTVTATSLIRPTDPEARLRVIKSGRNDPFAVLVPESQGGPPKPVVKPTVKPIKPAPTPVVTLPPLPQPDLARQVQVYGIAYVRGVPQAIVKAPEESVSRTVVPGDRLSNGQVLVKAIDISRGDPVVILEQVGVDVVVGIGRPAV